VDPRHRLQRRLSTRLLLSAFLLSSHWALTAGEALAADPPGAADTGETAPPLPVIPVEEVAVTSTRSERSTLEIPSNVTVIHRVTIDRSGAKDVPDLLRREAGLFVTNTTTNREGYTVEARGFNNGGGNGSGMLVLVDGRRVNEPSSSVADWSFAHLDDVERIEVVRGPASAVYGDNAMAGVVHIITRSGEGPWRAELRGRSGTYDSDAGSFFAAGSHGPVSGSLFIDGYSTDGYRDRSDFRSHHYKGNLRVALGDWGSLGLTSGYTSQVRERPGDLTKAEMALDRRQAEPGSDDNFDDVRQRFFQGVVELYPTEEVTLRLLPFYRRRNDSGEITDPETAFSFQSESDAAGVNSQLQWDTELLGRSNRFVAGFDFAQEDVDDDSLFETFGPFAGIFPSSTRNRRKVYGAFVQNELYVTQDLLLSLGLRREEARYRGRDRITGDEFRPKFTAWAPKAALTYRVSRPLSVYLSYGRGFRFPNLDEAFGFFGFAPGLDPQKSDSYEVGFKIRSERVTANLAAYTMNVHDEILFDPLAPNPFFLPFIVPGINVNLDRVRHRGIETQASFRPLEWLELYGSYTFDDTKITRDTLTGLEGNRMPITPRHRGTAGVRADLPYWTDVGLNANYVGSRYLANDLSNRFEKLPKFASYDAELRFSPPLRETLEAVFHVAVRNLTGREYTEFGGVSFFTGAAGYFPSPERSYEVGLVLRVTR
jgi:iron complex outermembrane receptor protein